MRAWGLLGLGLAVLLLAVLFLAACERRRAPQPPPAPPPPPPAVELVAVGDILMHQDVKRAALESGQGPAGLWTAMEPLLRSADLAFANLETPVAPASGQPGRPFLFNAPEDLPAALKASGFAVLSTANNHAYDQGVAGVRETLERLAAAGLVAVGSGATRAEAERPRIVQAHGLKVAFLGFTDLFNRNLNRGPGQPWVCPLDPDAAAAAVRAARTQADAVVVSLHWGVEYSHQPTPRQRAVAAQLAEAGADLILGAHPHVLQPVEVIRTGDRRTVVVYSMGNFISNQDRDYRPDPGNLADGDDRDGVAVRCRLEQERRPDGSLRVVARDPVCEPLWTVNNWAGFSAGRERRRDIRVLPVNATLAALQTQPAAPDPPGDSLQRTLELRLERAGEVLGGAYVAGYTGPLPVPAAAPAAAAPAPAVARRRRLPRPPRPAPSAAPQPATPEVDAPPPAAGAEGEAAGGPGS